MIRPEPVPGWFWPNRLTASNGPLQIHGTVKFEASRPNPATTWPHYSEDRVVIGNFTPDAPLKRSDALNLLESVSSKSLQEIFDGNLVVDGEKAYVPVGAECKSLGGLIVPSKDVVVESYNNQSGKLRLRIRFRDEGHAFAPNLTSTKAYSILEEGKIDELNSKISNASKLLLRIGLARGFPQMPNRCYLQVNGLNCL